jgi:hypothetical protein
MIDRYGLLVARGIVEITASDTNNLHSTLLVANISRKSVRIQKGEVLCKLQKDDDIEVLHTNESQCTATISTHEEVNCTIAQPPETKQQLIDQLHTVIPNLQIDLTDFSETQSKQIVDLLLEYSSLFSQIDAQPGVAVGVEHLIKQVKLNQSINHHTEYRLGKEPSLTN